MKYLTESKINSISDGKRAFLRFALSLIAIILCFGFTMLSINRAYSQVTLESELRICRGNPDNNRYAPDKDRKEWEDCLKKAYHKTKPNPDAVEMAKAIYKIWNKSVTKSALEKALKSIKTEDGAKRVFSDIQIKKGMDAIKRDKPVIRFFISLKDGQPRTTFTQEEPIGLVWDGDHISEYELFYMEKTGLEVGDKTSHKIPEREFKTDTTLILKASNKFGDETYKALTINIINPEFNGYVKTSTMSRSEYLTVVACGGRYLCTPQKCIEQCKSMGGRIATYAEVYAWAASGNDLCQFVWMLSWDDRYGLLRGLPMYNNQTKSDCGRVNTGNIPRMEGMAFQKWNTTETWNCACSFLK